MYKYSHCSLFPPISCIQSIFFFQQRAKLLINTIHIYNLNMHFLSTHHANAHFPFERTPCSDRVVFVAAEHATPAASAR